MMCTRWPIVARIGRLADWLRTEITYPARRRCALGRPHPASLPAASGRREGAARPSGMGLRPTLPATRCTRTEAVVRSGEVCKNKPPWPRSGPSPSEDPTEPAVPPGLRDGGGPLAALLHAFRELGTHLVMGNGQEASSQPRDMARFGGAVLGEGHDDWQVSGRRYSPRAPWPCSTYRSRPTGKLA
ncbi:MAG: hypothetical protein JWO67_1812 [Streptosporangiaceae bacterium]|nr:hypothetical protein [Streptosporangiaceae bacterium]